MRRYEGEAPCGGCERSGRISPRPSKNELCHNCYRDLRLGRLVKEQPNVFSLFRFGASGHRQVSCYNSPNSELKAVGLSERQRTDTPVYISAHDSTDGNSDLLGAAIFELLKTLDVGRKNNRQLEFRQNDFYHTEEFFLPTTQAVALYCFLDALAKYSRACRDNGYKDGQNLLVNLASGRISIEKFNEATIGK